MIHDHERLRALRESKGLTQEKLARLSKVSPRTVQRAEAGQTVSLETLNDARIACRCIVRNCSGGGGETDGSPASSYIGS